MTRLLRAAVAGSLLALVMMLATAARLPGGGQTGPPDLISWSQVGPDGVLSARAITVEARCPAILIDGAAQEMAVRTRPTPDFPRLACERDVPAEARRVALGGQPLPLLVADPQRIHVLGDTGCRIKGSVVQACNDPIAWPFAQIAASSAAGGPQLVIHVGDYFYREAACPAGNAGCAGSPHGDNWETWAAELFVPMAPLFRAAPIVFLRGDHETCDRGGIGWFTYLDPRPWDGVCQPYTAPWVVPLARHHLLVIDAATTTDFATVPGDVARYRADLQALRGRAGTDAWLLVHRPVWTIGNANPPGQPQNLFFGNPNLVAALEPLLPYPARLILSGHQHIFIGLDLVGRMPQLVIGQGGTLLDPPVGTLPAGLLVSGAAIEDARFVVQFGYVTMEPDGAATWRSVVRDTLGRPLATCLSEPSAQRC